WKDYQFDSPTGTGVQLNYVYLKSDGVDHGMQVGYGHGEYEFTKPGEYYMVTNIGGTEYELARFKVFHVTQDIVDQLNGGSGDGESSDGEGGSGDGEGGSDNGDIKDPSGRTEDPTVDYSKRVIKMSTKGGNTEDYETTDANPSNLVKFDTGTVIIDGVEYASFFVGDKIQNTHWWKDYQFDSPTGTGVQLNYVYLKSDGVDHGMQVGYGHGEYEFTKPGEYKLVTNIGGTEYELARFKVFWPTQDIIDQMMDNSQNGGDYYYEKQRVNLVVNDTTGKSCDYVGVDVADIHVSDSLYIDTIWSNYLFEYRIGKVSYQGTVDKVYLYGVDGEVSGYKQYVPGNMGENDHYTEVETGFGEYIDVNDPSKVDQKLFTFELTGTYAIYGEVVTASGLRQNIYMGSFKVTAAPTEAKPNEKFHYDDAHLYAYQPREIKYYIDDDSSYTGTHLTFDPEFDNVFYVSDKLVNGNYWSNHTFKYTDVYGKVHTGKIYNLSYVRVTETGTTQMGTAQVGYGHSTGTGDTPFELTEPGLWMLIGQQVEDNENGRINNIVMATFTVFELNEDDPRGTGDQFTDVSEALKWSGSFNKYDFKGDRNSINASGYLYARTDDFVSLQTIGHLRLGTIFNVVATYAKNVEVGARKADKFEVNAGDLKLQVKYDDALCIYKAELYYKNDLLGTSYFTEDYKSATGTYDIENKLGKITVYKDGTALKWNSTATTKEVTAFDISKNYYFNVADVSIGVAGTGSY
ncbi:MAG: hypothetical protein II286_00705, partial [Clostridia bacterium]|nr:hypothetical protein [Clostridia bacterium]